MQDSNMNDNDTVPETLRAITDALSSGNRHQRRARLSQMKKTFKQEMKKLSARNRKMIDPHQVDSSNLDPAVQAAVQAVIDEAMVKNG